MKTTTIQYTVAAVIYGLIAIFFLAMCALALHAAFATHREAFIPMSALYGTAGCGAIWAFVTCLSRAMTKPVRRAVRAW